MNAGAILLLLWQGRPSGPESPTWPGSTTVVRVGPGGATPTRLGPGSATVRRTGPGSATATRRTE